ncbi:DNA-binding response regulator [Rhodohalobacter sp. SW132]|uniref:response regulator transcription factor n=1 Tax=Rhodohalobacter sp. SW132 TaxID=2293433 RepID=UPI000E287B5F|nr:response regulator transcription factor [Rhodohalobacter sp. SW132]REL24960.1 DNA-binding response regulator [Rhodohalobacter sp. SW132]
MDNSKQITVFLYTGYTPRASALKERITKACDGRAIISLIDSENSILEKRSRKENSVVVLDLPNIKRSAVQTVKLVKKRTSKTKLLAIHIYTTRLLVNPLLDAGVDGYLTYEPSPEQIKEAITSVLDGEQYLPVDILS